MAAKTPPKSPCSVTRARGWSDLEKVILKGANGSSAEVYLCGAHVTSWQNAGVELLYVSSEATFEPPNAIIGGIAICFPHFEGHGNPERFGFVSKRMWSHDTSAPMLSTNFYEKPFVDLIYKPSEEDNWTCRYEFRLQVALGPTGNLILTSNIRNISNKKLLFTFAYHSCFSVFDISQVRVKGLEKSVFLDKLQQEQKMEILRNRGKLKLDQEPIDLFESVNQMERFIDQGDAITIESEVDKIYLNTPTKISIQDDLADNSMVMLKHGLPDAVVWNPWETTKSNFGEDEYESMLCLGAAAVEKPVSLEPGEAWIGRMELYAVSSSNNISELDPQKVLYVKSFLPRHKLNQSKHDIR